MDSQQLATLQAEADKHSAAVVEHTIAGNTKKAKEHASKLSEILSIIKTFAPLAGGIAVAVGADKGQVAAGEQIFSSVDSAIEGTDAPEPEVNQLQADREKQDVKDRVSQLEARMDAVEANLKIHNDIHAI